MSVIRHQGREYRINERTRVIRDGEEIGIATTVEEAMWAEVESLRQQLEGAVDTLAEVRLYAEKMVRVGVGDSRISGADLLQLLDGGQ